MEGEAPFVRTQAFQEVRGHSVVTLQVAVVPPPPDLLRAIAQRIAEPVPPPFELPPVQICLLAVPKQRGVCGRVDHHEGPCQVLEPAER